MAIRPHLSTAARRIRAMAETLGGPGQLTPDQLALVRSLADAANINRCTTNSVLHRWNATAKRKCNVGNNK